MINHRFKLENSFQEILYLIYVFINEGSGWNVESIASQYINTSTYRSLSGSSYISLPVKLQSLRKGLINIKNKDKKYFLWCHVRHIKPSKEHPGIIRKINKKLFEHITNPEEITDEDKEFISHPDYEGIEFSVQEKDFEDELLFPIYVSDQKFEDSMNLLLLNDDDKSHYVYIKDF